MKWCEETDRVPKVKLYPEPKRRIRFLTVEQAKALLRRLPHHQRVVAMFALATGLRQRNVLDLQWEQINLEERSAWIYPDQAKGGEGIPIPLNEIARSRLDSQRGKHPKYVFTYNGQSIGQINTCAWRKALVDVGITNFRWHDLRHTWATWLAMKGTTLSELQELGGWKSASMVRRYAHFSASHLAHASARLNGMLDAA